MIREFILLSVLTLFISLTSFAQEDEYIIIDSLKNSVLEFGDVEVYPINEVEIGTVETGIRKILIADSISIAKEISGRFVKETGPIDMYGASGYHIMKSDYKHFVKNELVITDTIQNYVGYINSVAYYAGSRNNYIIKNVETGKLYYTKGDILNNWGRDYRLVKLFSQIDKLNIKRQNINEKIILQLNGSQCVLTADIVQAIFDGDASGIKIMNESVNKYKEYNKTASDIAVKLANHIKQYKARLLKEDGLAAWKKDTKECDALLTKMRNLPYASSEYYNEQLDEEEIKIHTTILDLVRYSKDKLGI